MSTSTKTNKTRVTANTATPVKIMGRAGNNRKAPVKKIQSDLTKDEAVFQDVLMVSMEALTGKMTVLSRRVDAAEEWEKDAENPPVSHRPTCATRRRASPSQGQQIQTKKWQRRYARGWPSR